MKRVLIALAMTVGLTLSVMTPAHAWDRSDLTHIHNDSYKHFACKKVRGSILKVHTFSYGFQKASPEIGAYSTIIRQGTRVVEKASTKREGGRIRTILVTSVNPQNRVWVQGTNSSGPGAVPAVAVSSLRECPWE